MKLKPKERVVGFVKRERKEKRKTTGPRSRPPSHTPTNMTTTCVGRCDCGWRSSNFDWALQVLLLLLVEYDISVWTGGSRFRWGGRHPVARTHCVFAQNSENEVAHVFAMIPNEMKTNKW